jgi:D-arabinose 1-dehydrogenase-like Zn-dependent alcohol dehydrogenase
METTTVHHSSPAEIQGSSYRAVQAVSPGCLELTEKPLVEPPAGYVRIRVEACGVCHSDAATVDGTLPIDWPRVPGHEAVGRIDRVGDDVVISVPEELPAVDAAPLLCAGLTTFSALRDSPAKAAELVAISGIGGLGHLAVQYARKMGFEVAAIGRGTNKAELAVRLGAHHYIDSSATDAAEALQALGGAAVVLVTASPARPSRRAWAVCVAEAWSSRLARVPRRSRLPRATSCSITRQLRGP